MYKIFIEYLLHMKYSKKKKKYIWFKLFMIFRYNTL